MAEPASKTARTVGAANELRVAFIGCGNIAAYHLSGAGKTGRVRVTTLVDLSPQSLEAFKKKLAESAVLGAASEPPRCFSSIDEAIAADRVAEGGLFDAVDVMVPSFLVREVDLHEQIASAVIVAGKHLLLEKPLTVTPEAALRLVDLHRERSPGTVFAVAENAQFFPEVVAAQEAIARGDIGEVISARAKFWESAMGEWAVDYLPGTWRCDDDKLPAASFTYDGSSHWIRPLRMLLGEVESVVGVIGKSIPHMAGASTSQHIFKFSSGKTAIFESLLAPLAISDQPFFCIQGTKGEIVINGTMTCPGGRVYKADATGETVLIDELPKAGWDAGYDGEYADFVAACLDGVPTKGPVAEGIADLLVVRAMFASAESGSWQTVAWPKTVGAA